MRRTHERTLTIRRPGVGVLATKLGIGEHRRDRSGKRRWYFTLAEVDQMRAAFAAPIRTGAGPAAKRVTASGRIIPERAEEKILVYAAQMLADKFCPYSEREALQRAREAYLPEE